MNKASGGDGILVELFKTWKDDVLKVLHSICQQTWKIQQWPQNWKKSVFIPIPKKGNAKECSNYCTIALISHAAAAAATAKWLQSYLTLCDPIDGGPPGLCPWDSLGKNTGMGCHFLLQCMKVKNESEVIQLCPTLSDLMDCSLPGFSVHGILQARALEWVAISFSNARKWKVKVKSLSCIWLSATPWTAALQASLSITNSWSLLKLMSIGSVMPSNHLILCRPLLLPSVFPRVFYNKSVLCIRWPKYWSFSFSMSASNEYSRLI